MAKKSCRASSGNFRSHRKNQSTSQKSRCKKLSLETLEQRQLLSLSPVISEFMASNSSTLSDYYGKNPDWLEIYNPDIMPMNFSGWKLKDNNTVWTVPANVTIPAQGYLKIFCDERNSIAPNGELHASFKLGASGDYLGLLKPDDTVVSEFAPEYPQQYTDVSYGLMQEQSATSIISTGAAAKAFVPTAANGGSTLGSVWQGANEPFADSAWTSGTTGVGISNTTVEPIASGNLKLRLNADTSGAIVTDTSTAGHSGTNVGASWVASSTDSEAEPLTRNGAMQFNASENDQVTVPAGIADFYNTTQGTISFWMRSSGTSGAGTDGAVLFDLRSNRGMQITQTDSGQIRMRCYQSDVVVNDLTSNATVSDDQWHLVSVSFTQAAGTACSVYIDGALENSGNNSSAWGWTTTYVIEIGRCTNHGTPPKNFNGFLDDFRFYNAVLTPSQIASIATGADESVSSSDVGLNVQNQMFNVNSSAYIRVPFTITDPASIDNLLLSIRHNDGFIAWINGVQVGMENAPTSPSWNSAATSIHSPGKTWRGIIDDVTGLLHAGTNILAIQGLNNSSADSSFLIVPQLSANVTSIYGTEGRYFVTPTPGKANSSGTTDLGPIVSDVSHPAVQPGVNDPIVVTAHVSATLTPLQAGSVVLHYRAMYRSEYTVTMYDNGTNGDVTSGDGIFTGIIPAGRAAAGEMLRWYVSAADTLGHAGRFPLLVPVLTDNHDGGPEYEGTVIADPSMSCTLPIIQTFIVDPAAANDWSNRTGTRGSVFYLGRFYDNVFVRCRGGYTTNGNKFKFNSGYDFIYAEDQPSVTEINLNMQGWDDTYTRPTVAFGTMSDAGVPASTVFPLRVQRNGQYYMVMYFIEQFDDRLLEREGLYGNGAIYKSYTDYMDNAGNFRKENRDEVPGTDDLQQFLNGLHLTDAEARRKFIYDNVNIPVMLDYLAANVLYLDNDQVAKNYYIFCDTNDGSNAIYDYANPKGTNEWAMAPWDKDLTFGKDYGFSDYSIPDPYAHPFFSDSDHPKIDGPYNWLVDAMLDIPEIKQMYLRRLRTMMDEFLQPLGTNYTDRYFESKFDELAAKLTSDPFLVSTLGDLTHFFDDIKTKYLDVRRNHLYVDHSLNTSYPDYAGIPGTQADNLVVNFGSYEISPTSGIQDQEYLTLVNPNSVAIDLSGWKLAGGIGLTFKKGVVIPAGGTLYVSPNVFAFRQRTTGPSGNQGLLVQGNYNGSLSNWGESIQLIDAEGNVVSTLATPSNPSLAQQNLRITELMYHPADPPKGSPYTNDDFQFIELKNTSATQTLSLSGVRFTDGVVFNFTGSSVTSLAPGGRVLVVANLSAFQSRYGTSLNGIIAGQFAKAMPTDFGTTHLSKSGEKVTLVDSVGETILSFSYQDDWYKQSDGTGNSLVIRDASAVDRDLWGQREGWAASHAASGSPGTDEVAAYANDAIVVNELLSHRIDGANALGDWVEFYNTTSSPINIGGWYLSNDDADMKKFQIAAGTIIPANGYKAFNWRDNFGSTSNAGCTTPFTFGELGGNVYLTSATSGVLTEFQASEEFGSIDTGITFGRYIKSTGGKDFVATSSPTYETANASPAVGPVVINEIYYHPTTGKDSFIELKNITGQTVPLYDPARPQNTWHLAEGVELDFPAGASIAANGYALIVNIDPAYFRTKYNIPAAVPIYGPYLYDLSNSGDTIELKYPDDPQPDGKVPYDRMDQVTYGDSGAWPVAADGFRASLSRISATAYGNDVANWEAGWATPGAANAAFIANPITLTTPATATPGTVTGTATSLTALADSSIYGASSLIYSWSTAAMPAGAPAPTFSVNGSYAARNTTVTFGKAGTYTFTVTIYNIFGASVASTVNVNVVPTQSGLSISPSSLALVPSETRQFAFVSLDQFGNFISSIPNVTWSASAGTINSSTGLYTAPSTANSSITITAQSSAGNKSITVQAINPTAWWKFDQVSGTTTPDGSGNGRTGTLVGSPRPTLATGKINNALTFNGTNDYVTATALNLNSNTVTISGWIKRSGNNVEWEGIIFARGNNTCSGLNFGGAGTNELRYHWNEAQYDWSTGLIVPDNTWTFIALAVQADRATMYMKPFNAAMQSAVHVTPHVAEEFDSTTYIGQDPAGGRFFKGAIDDVRFYNSTLSAAAIAALADEVPSNIALSNTTVPENQAGVVVGALTTTDPGETNFTYQLQSDPTGKFEIVGSSLKLKSGQSLDYETTPSTTLSILAIDSGGLSFSKSLTISVVNVAEPMIVTTANWASAGTAGMTLKFAADNKLHFYKTGTTTDMVTPQPLANVSAIDVTGRGVSDILVVESMGAGVPFLVIHNATTNVALNTAIPAATQVTIDGGAMNFTGQGNFGGNLLFTNGGQATVTNISNNSTTVQSGTLTATSIVCDTLIIGSHSAAGANLASDSRAAVAKNYMEPLPVDIITSLPDVNAGNSPDSPVIQDEAISSETIPAKLIAISSDSVEDSMHSEMPPAIAPAVTLPLEISQETASVDSIIRSSSNDAPRIDPLSDMPKENVKIRIQAVMQVEQASWKSVIEPSSTAKSVGEQARFAALQSVARQYRDGNSDGYAVYGYILQNRLQKPAYSHAKAVDAVLAIDDGLVQDQ
jgi:hypothetical protein